MQICTDKNKSEGSGFFSPFHLPSPVHILLSCQPETIPSLQYGQEMNHSLFSCSFLKFFILSLPCPPALLPPLGDCHKAMGVELPTLTLDFLPGECRSSPAMILHAAVLSCPGHTGPGETGCG